MNKLLLSATVLLVAANAQQQIISLHGSGTTNPSKCYWQIMDQMKSQARAPLHMTYRAIGSGQGQAEFTNEVSTGNATSVVDVMSLNDFGSGDLAMSAEDYSKISEKGGMVHVPIVLGAVSVFHSVPTDRLNLTACNLAKIFKREIKEWDHPEILGENPGLEDKIPQRMPITVAHRVYGSSSTSGFTSYLRAACPDHWPEEMVGKTITWPSDTAGCEGSGGMSDCIKNEAGTIGYIDSGHGWDENLAEIELKNRDGYYLTSYQANKNGGIASAADEVPNSPDADFSNVNLLNQPGQYTWPIVSMSYVYVRKNITSLPVATQGLLKAFLNRLLDHDTISACSVYGFVPVAEKAKEVALKAIDMIEISPIAPEFIFEKDTLKPAGAGQAEYVISAKRRDFGEYERSNLEDEVVALKEQIDDLTRKLKILESGGNDGEVLLFTLAEEQKLEAALALGVLSMVVWFIALTFGCFYRKYLVHV